MRPFVGCREIGLKTVWRFGFVGPGTTAEPVPGVLYIDVGGALREGIVDHHSDSDRNSCSTELTYRHREAVYNHLMRDWLKLHSERKISHGTEWNPVLITHEFPDWDSVAAAFLAMYLIEEGDFPPYADALVHYVREVDQGRYPCSLKNPDTFYAIHLAYRAMQSVQRSSEEQMLCGLEVIRRSVDLIGAAREEVLLPPVCSMEDFLPGKPGATGWLEDPWFASAREILSADRVSFEKDLARARTIEHVRLPATDGGEAIHVPTLVAGAPMESRLHKEWVRSHGYPFFICPFGGPNDSGEAGGPNTIFHRVVLSIDPNFDVGGRKPHLLGLGFNLERSEVSHRKARHGGLDDRSGAPRFGDGYCTNDDPWYDGRAFGHTIVDSPRSGTLIPFEEIVRMACETPFWEVPLRSALVSLVWRSRDGDGTVDSNPLDPHPGLASTLEHFHRESREAELPAPQCAAGLPQNCSLSLRVRLHPGGTCPPFLIATLIALPGATLEALVEARAAIIGAIGSSPPEYSLAKIVPARSCSAPSRIDHLLRRLNDGEYAQSTRLTEHEEMLLFNNRAVVLRGRELADAPEEGRAELEVLLYLAFLNETIAEFSSRISSLVPPGKSPTDAVTAEPVCQDFLRFQARYYQLDVCRTGRGRIIWERLAAAVSLAENYMEVRSELDRLAQLEAQIAERKRARTESLLELGLYAVALFGVYQTLIAYYANKDLLRSSMSFWIWVIGATLGAVAFYAWAVTSRHGKKGS